MIIKILYFCVKLANYFRMKKILFLLLATICFCACKEKEEKLAIAGSGWNDIAIINKKTGIIEWKHTLEPGDECNDIEVTPEGNILFAYARGAKLMSRNHETLWEYKAGENEEIHTASRLPDGGIMVGVCGEPARIIEFDRNGKQTNEITFRTYIFDISYQFRQVTKTDDGIYLVPLIARQTVLRYTMDGQSIGLVYAGYDVFSAKQLENKNLLISCGRNSLFLEINPEKQQKENIIVTREIQGGVLRYVAEIYLYKNGNKLIANSNMFSVDKSQPLLIEIDSNNRVVWKLPYNKEINNITAVYSFFE